MTRVGSQRHKKKKYYSLFEKYSRHKGIKGRSLPPVYPFAYFIFESNFPSFYQIVV